MKNNKYSENILRIILLSFMIFTIKSTSLNLENNSENLQKISKIKEMEELIKSYLDNPESFILTHNNRENFIAVLSNFTRLNGEEIYEEYLEKQYQKDIQTVIDHMNNIKIKHVNNWDYDSVQGKFILPDDSKLV